MKGLSKGRYDKTFAGEDGIYIVPCIEIDKPLAVLHI